MPILSTPRTTISATLGAIGARTEHNALGASTLRTPKVAAVFEHSEKVAVAVDCRRNDVAHAAGGCPTRRIAGRQPEGPLTIATTTRNIMNLRGEIPALANPGAPRCSAGNSRAECRPPCLPRMMKRRPAPPSLQAATRSIAPAMTPSLRRVPPRRRGCPPSSCAWSNPCRRARR
jgi:hypothetical protein